MTRIFITWIVLACIACGEPLPDTVGDVYEDMSDSMCVTLVDCGGYDGTTAQCANELYDVLCEAEGVNCAEPVDAEISRSEWNDCLDALETMSCSAAESGELPRACQ